MIASGSLVVPNRGVFGASATRSQNESLWKWSQSARSPEDAILLADELGAFKDVVDDIRPSKLNSDVMEVVTHDGLTARFAFLEDSTVDSIVNKSGLFDNVLAYYQPGKRFVTSADNTLIENGAVPVSPDKVMEEGDIFLGNAITINVKKSLLKSDQGVASILAHEFHEIHGLYKQVSSNRVLYKDLQSSIDRLHGQAVKIGDEIAYKAR